MNHQQFASDNYAGICPDAWRALEEANRAPHTPGYGADDWTARTVAKIQTLFETDCEVFFATNGTAANSLALAAMCKPYQSVVCSASAHIHTDECNAPEFFTGGAKIISLPEPAAPLLTGKLDQAALTVALERSRDVHFPVAKVVSLSQTTELGAVYTEAEIRAVAENAHSHGATVHMDGARFANAVAALETSPAAITWRAGVDVLSFGGIKNGLASGEAVVFFNRALCEGFRCRVKQGAQLASKMRFVTAPWLGLLETGAWLDNARRANRMTALLEDLVVRTPGVKLLAARQANALFVEIPIAAMRALWDEGWQFYEFFPGGQCRLMCAWDTTEESVRAFAAAFNRAVRAEV